jgi:hypothetical protein
MAGLVVLILLGGAGYAAYHYRARLPLVGGAAGDQIAVYGAKVAVYRDKLIDMLPKQLPFFHSDKEASSAPPAPARATAPATPPPAATPPAAAPPSSSGPAPPSSAPTATTPPAATPPSGTATAPGTAPRVDPPASPAQLEVDLSASKIELVDGRYVIHGEIINHGGTAGAPTKLTVQFKKGNDVLISRSYPLTLGPIAAGDRQAFSQVLDNPPPGATDIVPAVE